MKYLFLVFLIPFFAKAEDPYRTLSPEDYSIYLETFHQCQTGTVGAALKTATNPAIMKSAALNLTQIMMLSLQASKERIESRFLSPETARLKNSDGFWLAFSHCYSQSSEGRRILIKNIIDAGHLTAEVVGTVGSLYAASEMAAYNLQLAKSHPFLTRLFLSVGLNVTLYEKYKAIKHEYFSKPTLEESKVIRSIESDMFKDVDQTMNQILALAEVKLKSLDNQISDGNLSAEKITEITQQKAKLTAQINSLRQSMAR